VIARGDQRGAAHYRRAMHSVRLVTTVLGLLVGVAACAQQREVRLEPSATFQAPGGSITAAAFSRDGKLLATGGDIGDLRVLDLATNEVSWTAQPSDHWIGVIAFSPDGKHLACRGRHLTIHLATTGEELLRVEHVGPRGFAWCRDGKRFVYSNGRDLVVRDGERETGLASFEYPINAIAIGDGEEMFVGDNVGRTWRVPASGGAAELRHDHRTKENDMVRSVDLLFAGGALFDLASRSPLRRNEASFEPPSTAFVLAVTDDGRSFAVGGLGDRRTDFQVTDPAKVRWWIDGGASFEDFVAPGCIAALAFAPDRRQLFVSTSTGRQSLHERGREPIELPGHRSRIEGLAMTPDGRTLAIKGSSWSLHSLDGRPASALPGAVGVEAGRGDTELIVQYADRAVVLDTLTGKERGSVPTPRRHRDAAKAGPAELLFVTDELVDRSGVVVAQLPKGVLVHNFNTVAFANDGRWALGGVAGIEGDLGGLVITDAAGENLRVVDDCPVHTVAFSPDGKRLFYGCASGISVGMGPPNLHLRVKDTETLQLLHQLDVSVSEWRFLDERRALVGTMGKLQVWDVERLVPIQTLPLPRGGFLLSNDKRTLVTATATEVQVHRLIAD